MGTVVTINGKTVYLKSDNVTIDQVKNSEGLKEKYKFDPSTVEVKIMSGSQAQSDDLEEAGILQTVKTKAGSFAKSVKDFMTSENRDPNVMTIDDLPVAQNANLKALKEQYGMPDSQAGSVKDFFQELFQQTVSEDSAENAKTRLENIREGSGSDVPKTEFDKKLAKLRLQLTIPMSDEKRKNAISNIHKDTKFGKDESGNMTITWNMPDENGKLKDFTFYPNPTGLDETDIIQASTAVLATLPATKVIKAIGLPIAGFTGGTLVGSTSGVATGGLGVASGMIGAEDNKPVEWTPAQDAVLGGLFGGPFQKAGEVVLSLARGALSKAGSIFATNGSLRTEVRDGLRQMGFSSEEIAGIKGAVVKKMNELVTKKVDPQTASSFGMSQNLPEPIPLSRGQMSGNKADQVFEKQIEEGFFGEGAGKNAMEVLRKNQFDAIEGNIGKLQDELAGGNPTISRGQGGEDAQTALVAKKGEEYKVADDLYIKARQQEPVTVDYDDLSTMYKGVYDRFDESFGNISAPKTGQFVEQLKGVDTLKEIFAIRQKLTAFSNSASDGTERGASGAVVSTLDDQLDQIVTKIFNEESLAKGSMSQVSDSVKQWFTAIKGYKDYSNKWNSKGSLLKVLTTGKGDKLDVSAESVTNKIFTMNAVSWSGKTNFFRSLEELKGALPAQEWNKIQQEAFIKIMDMGKNNKGFSGANFAKKFEELKDQAPKSMDILFGKEMLTRMTQFSKIAEKATTSAKNTSNSASSLLNMLWMGMGGQKLAVVIPALNTQYKNIASMRGSNRINYDKSMLTPKGKETNTTGGGLGGAFGVSREEENDPIVNSPRF